MHNVPHTFSNGGRIPPEAVTFDDPPLRAWGLPPPCRPPMLMVVMTGYAGTLTLSAGVYAPQKEVVERFLDRILLELPE